MNMSEYTVKTVYGCKIVYGQVPMSEMSHLMQSMSEGAVMSTSEALRLGAVLVIGEPDGIARLKELPTCDAIKKQAGLTTSDAAARWIEHGERGASSETIFSVLTGIKLRGSNQYAHPLDPADFRRCRLLLDQVPEIALRFESLRSVSTVWSRLVDNWESLCGIMDDECPQWRTERGTGEKTYAEMKKLGC